MVPPKLTCPKCGGPRERPYDGAKSFVCKPCRRAERRVEVKQSRRVLVCPDCGGPREARTETTNGKTYMRWRCMPCIRLRAKAWREANPERKKAQDAARRATPKGRAEHRSYGVSDANKARQRTEKARERNRQNARRQYQIHRDRALARKSAYEKLAKNRPETCQRCGIDPGKGHDGRSLLTFHHTEGYSRDKRFVGEWICTKCHGKEHRKHQ